VRNLHVANAHAARLVRGTGAPVATIHNLSPIYAADSSPESRARAARVEEVMWRSWAAPELMEPFDLSQPTISKHLKVLERAGLVSRGREAQFRPVRLNAAPLEGAAEWLGDYRRFWTESLDRLDVYVKELKRKEGRHAGKRRRR